MSKMTLTAFANKHCSSNLRDKTTTTKVNLSIRIYKERKAGLLDGKCNFILYSQREEENFQSAGENVNIPLFARRKSDFLTTI